MDLPYKKAVYDHCVYLLSIKINLVNSELKAIQEDVNHETKSSAGDKYETGRAMSQLQKGHTSSQLNHLLKLKKVLDEIVIAHPDKVRHGSLVITDSIRFFVSIGLSEQLVDKIFAISPVSPFCKEFLGKSVGDKVVFKGVSYLIHEIA